MAYLQARSGIARSGVTYCGWTPPSVTVTVGGTVRGSKILGEDWNLTARADGTPPTFTFRTKEFTPVIGQDVKFAYATPDEYLFGGTILQRQALPLDRNSTKLQWRCTAVGYPWLLSRYDRVRARYFNVGVGTMVADILYRFTDGGFRVGYIPSSLGNLTMDFTNETVWAALQRIAKAVDGVLDLTPARVINIYTSYPEAALATVTQTSILDGAFTYQEDGTQLRTRTLHEGRGSTVTAAVATSATTIPVADASPFSVTGGSAVCGQNRIAYTGLSAASGPGSLTGVTGMLYDLSENDAIQVLVEVNDVAAQAALAAILGSGLSGIATNYLQDGRLSASEATARGNTDLATFSGSLEEMGFTYTRPLRHVRAGRSVVVNVTAPVAIAGTFTIQDMTLTPYGIVSGTKFEVWQQVQLAGFTRTLTDLLRQLRG
jgi:hypothetical protein